MDKIAVQYIQYGLPGVVPVVVVKYPLTCSDFWLGATGCDFDVVKKNCYLFILKTDLITCRSCV